MKPPDAQVQRRPVDDPLRDAAKRIFDVDYLYPYQRLVIANTIEAAEGDRDAPRQQMVLLPTGAGKSLCFQLPAALLPGCTVVVYPLLSLIADQERRLQQSGIESAALTGATAIAERKTTLRHVQSGRLRLLLTNPESLAAEPVLHALADSDVVHLVVDEAHCICEWGETFRPAYLELGRLVAEIGPRVLTAFTATASATVLDSIRTHLFGGQPVRLISANPDRPNIRYYVIEAASVSRALVELLGGHAPGPTALGSAPPQLPLPRPAIVFCRSRAGTRLTAVHLRRALGEDQIRFYHAGLNSAEKQAIEKWFLTSRNGILVATCAYGMGVDKSDIRSVIHPQAAPTIESFLQESGRAGRDGQPSISITLRPSAAQATEAAPAAASSAEQLRQARSATVQRFLLTERCRRAFLLEAMDAARQTCSGCDRCDAVQQRTPPALTALSHTVRQSRRRLSRAQLCRLLNGNLVSRDLSAGIMQLPHFAALPGWSSREIEELTDSALSTKLVRSYKRGPWRNTLDSAPRHAS